MNCFFCGHENANIFAEIYTGTETTTVNICESCSHKDIFNHKCAHCNMLLDNNSYLVYTNNGTKALCMHCKIEYNICEHCGSIFEKDTDWLLCYECRPTKYTRDYFYKPQPIFFKMPEEKEDNLYIGIEYEIGGARKTNAEKFLKDNFHNQYFYSKYDNSIPKYGFEIVSHPATEQAHKNIMPWKDVFNSLKELNITGTDNCGIHFHVNRTFFNEDNIRVADFIVNNFEDIISQYSGRSYNHYCAKRMKELSEWGRSDYSSHHDAINLTPRNTVEFRFCYSTNEIEKFFNKINFITKLCHFVKEMKFLDVISSTIETKNKFVNYLEKN